MPREITIPTQKIKDLIVPLAMPMLLNLPSGEISFARFESKIRRLVCCVLYSDLHNHIKDHDETEDPLPAKLVTEIIKVCKTQGRKYFSVQIELENKEPVFEWTYDEDQKKLGEEDVPADYRGYITIKTLGAKGLYDSSNLIQSTEGKRTFILPPMKAQTADCKYFKACCFAILNSDNGRLKKSELLQPSFMGEICKNVCNFTMPKNAETLFYDFLKNGLLRQPEASDYVEVSRRFRKEHVNFVKGLVDDSLMEGEELNRRKNQVAFVR